MNDNNLRHSHEEGNISEETQSPQQQRAGVEARSARLVQLVHLQQRHLDVSADRSSSSPDDGVPDNRTATCNSISYGSNQGSETSASMSSSTDASILTGATVSPDSSTGRRTSSDNDSSNTAISSGTTKTDADAGPQTAVYSEWRLPGAAPLSAVASFCTAPQEQHEALKVAAATSHQMSYGQHQNTPYTCENGEGGSINSNLERDWETGTNVRYPTLVDTDVEPTSSRPHQRERFVPVQGSPDRFFCLPATGTSLTPHRPSAHTAGFGRGFLRGSKSGTRKRIRRDSSSSCSEHDGCTVPTPFECFPDLSAALHTPPASPTVHPSFGGVALPAREIDNPRLSLEPHGQVQHKDDAPGAHLHAALLQQLCTTPRRRKLSSSSSSAASDEQQTVASLSSPGMLYTPLRTPRNGTAQQRHLQMQQELSQRGSAEPSETPREQLHQQEGLLDPLVHEQVSPQLSYPERHLSVSTLMARQVPPGEEQRIDPRARDLKRQEQMQQQAQEHIRQQAQEQMQLHSQERMQLQLEHQAEQQMQQQMQHQIQQQMRQVEEQMQQKLIHEQMHQQFEQQMQQHMTQQQPFQVSPVLVGDEGAKTEQYAGGSLSQRSDTVDPRGSQHDEITRRESRLSLRNCGACENAADGAGQSADESSHSVASQYSSGITEHLDHSACHLPHATAAHVGETANSLAADGKRVSVGPISAGVTASFPVGSHAAAGPVMIRFPDPAEAGGEEVQPQRSPPRRLSTPPVVPGGSSSCQQPQTQGQSSPSSAFAAISRILQEHITTGTTSGVMNERTGGQMTSGKFQDENGFSSDVSVQSATPPSVAAPNALSRPPVLNSLGYLRDAQFSAVREALNSNSDAAVGGVAPSGGCTAVMPPYAAREFAAAGVRPSDAAPCLPYCKSTTPTSGPGDEHENLVSFYGTTAGGSSSHLVNQQDETRRAGAERDYGARSGGPLAHSHETVKQMSQQLGSEGGGIPAAVAKRRATAISTPPYIAPSPPPHPTLAAETPAYQDAAAAASPKEMKSFTKVERELLDENPLPEAPAATDPIPAGNLTEGRDTSPVALALHEAEAPKPPDRACVAVDGNTRLKDTPQAPVAHGRLVPDVTPQADFRAEAEGRARPEKNNSFDVQNHAAQQLRLHQVIQVLQEHRIRLRVLEEETSERILHVSDGPEYHALHTRLQRFQRQQRLLRQLQQRVESRSLTLWRQEQSGIDELRQLEQQLDEGRQQDGGQGEVGQQAAEPREGSFQADNSQGRKRHEGGRMSQNRGSGDATEDSYCGLERHRDETGRKAGLLEVSQAADTSETLSCLTDPSAGEAKRAAEERPCYKGYPSGATPAATTDTPTVKPAEAAYRFFKPTKSWDTSDRETDSEDPKAAIMEKRHQEDVAALICVRRKFLRRHQEQQQNIPLPEESSTEMYWASLLQPTETLLDRTVALSTSLIQPGVYVYLNRCFWESNQKDWTSNHAHPYSCSSSSCSSSVPCHISRPGVDLLPVYYSSRRTPVHSLAALSPPAAAAAAVAPSDADSILNFCFRVSLLRRCNKRRHPPHQRRGIHRVQEDRSSGKSSSNSTACSSNSSTNSGTDTSGSGTDAGSRRGSGDDGEASTTAERKIGEIPSRISTKDGQDSTPLWPDGSTTTGERSSAPHEDFSGESAIHSLLPFPPNILPLHTSTRARDDAVAHSATVGTTGGPAEAAGDFRDAGACSVPAYGSPAGDRRGASLPSLSIFPVLPPLELKGPYPAWILEATRAAAIAAKAALAVTDAPDGREVEEERGTEVIFGKEEEQQLGTYVVSVPVSLYGFSLSRRMAAAARDAAFNRIAAAAAVVAAASSVTGACSAADTDGPAGGERQGREGSSVDPLTGISYSMEADGSDSNPSNARVGAASVSQSAPTGRTTVRRHSGNGASSEQPAMARRRSSVSSTSSKYFRYSMSDDVGSWKNERRRSSADSRCEFDRAWNDISRDMLLRRDPPLRKAWVSGISWRRGSSDQKSTYWSRSGHTSGGGSSGYGSNSPSPFNVAWRQSTQRSSWWGGGGTSGGSGRESSFYALRDQQQGSVAFVDVPTQAEGIFVLRERATALPLAVRATVFCPNDEKTIDESMSTDSTSGFAETFLPGGSGTSGVNSSRQRTCSPTRLGRHPVQGRRGATGSASATAGSSNLQQGGQLLSKLFVVDAHATSAEEPMPVKLRRVKQMAKAWFRHKKLLALLLYWQRSQQQPQHCDATEISRAEGHPPQQPVREGKREWKKRPSTDGNAARVAEMQAQHLQESGDEGMEREAAETRDTVEVEALTRLLRGEMEEAAATFTSRSGRQDSGSSHQADKSETQVDGCIVSRTRGSFLEVETHSGSTVKDCPECTKGDDVASSKAGNARKTPANTSRGALPLGHAASSVGAERDGEQQQRKTVDAQSAADSRHCCWSLRIGLRWRESYFAFEYYVAAIHTPTQPETQLHQRHGKGLPEDVDLGFEQEPESTQVEPRQQKQQERSRRHLEHRSGDEQAPKDGPATDHRGSAAGEYESEDGSYWRSETAKRNGAPVSAVLLLDEMLQPCLCDVTAVQHAFQAVMMRLLPFVCINSGALRLLLRQSPELLTLSRTMLQRLDGAPMHKPQHQDQSRVAQEEQQIPQMAEEEQVQKTQQQERHKHPVQLAQQDQQEKQDQRRQEQQQQQKPEQDTEQHDQQDGRKRQQEPHEQEQHVKEEEEQQEDRQEQKEKQAEQQQMEEQQRGGDMATASGTVQGLNDIVVDEIVAAVEIEEHLQRSSASAIAAAFHEGSSSSAISGSPSDPVEPGGKPSAGEPTFLPLFLFDCLLQSNYLCAVDATPVTDPCSAESVCSAAAAVAFAINAAEETPAGDDMPQVDKRAARIGGAAVSLVLAARQWGASLVDGSRTGSNSIPGKRTDVLVEKSWLPFRLQGIKRERNTAKRLRQLLLGTFVNGGSGTTSGGATTDMSAPSQASAAAGSSAPVFTEDHMEIPGTDRDDITVEERRKVDAVTKLERQIRWLSVRCSYIGVTDAPAKSCKAALLLALLFPSQQQLLLEHLELRDFGSQDTYTHVAKTFAPAVAEACGGVPHLAQHTRPSSQLAQSHDKEQPQPRRVGVDRPLRPGQQMRHEKTPQEIPDDHEREPGRHKQCPKHDIEVLDTSRKHNADFRLLEKSIHDGEVYDEPDEEELFERVRIAAEMMLEGGLEELWPGQDDDENAWQRVFENSGSKREVLEEMCLLDTELPSFTDEASAAPAESAGGPEQTEQQPDAGVVFTNTEKVTDRNAILEQPDEESQHQQPQRDRQSGKMHECEQQQCKGEQQPPVYAEQAEERLALQEEFSPSSSQNKTAAPAERQETHSTLGSFPNAPHGVGTDAVATEREANASLLSSEERSAVGVSSDAPEDSDGVRGESGEEGRQQQTNNGKEFGGVTLASVGQAYEQDGSEGYRPAEAGLQHLRVKVEGEVDEKASAKTNRLEELLLLPVEYSGLANPADRAAGAVLVRDYTTGAHACEKKTRALFEDCAQQQQQKARNTAQFHVQHKHEIEGAKPEIRGDETADDNGKKRGGFALCRAAEPERLNFYSSEGFFFLCSYPSSDSLACREKHCVPVFQDSQRVCFAPLWRPTCHSSADRQIAAAIPWYAAAAMRLAAADLMRPLAFAGRSHASGEGKKKPVAHGGADAWLLLRWYNSCVAGNSSAKKSGASVRPSNRDTSDGESTRVIVPRGDESICSKEEQEETATNRAIDDYSCTGPPVGDGAAHAPLEKLLLTCGSRRRPQQRPLWAGGIDVSRLREGLDYRIDWRRDCDIGDGRLACGLAKGDSSSSTSVESSSSSEEEDASTEERAAKKNEESIAPAGAHGVGTTVKAGGGRAPGRRIASEAENGGESASGVDEHEFRQQEKKKSLRERLLSSSVSSGRLPEAGREPLQAVADIRHEKALDYVEERLVDQQLRDFLQGLLATVRSARAATLATRHMTHPPRTTTGTASGASTPGAREDWGYGVAPGKLSSTSSGGGRGSRYLPAGTVYKEDLFPSSAFEVGAGASFAGDAMRKHPTWNASGAIAPAWLFSLAAAEVTQSQLRAAATGRLPGTSPSSGVWSYVLLPAAVAAAAPLASSTSAVPAVVGGRGPLRQQQEEARRQQEESRTMAASALAAAATLLRQQQEDLRAAPGRDATMPWTSLYLAAATDAAAAAVRQVAQAPGGRHRAELSLPSSTCSTPRPAHHLAAVHGIAGAASGRRGGAWKSVSVSPSPAAADTAVSAATAVNVPGSPREGSASSRGSTSASSSADAVEGADACRSNTSTSAGGGAYTWTQATGGPLSGSSTYSAAAADGGRAADSAAAGPYPLANALLAALQQQPPPTHSLPHHLFSPNQRLPQQHPGPLHLATAFQQQQLHRRVSWDIEMRQPPSGSPSQSRRGSSSVNGTEAGSDRFGAQSAEVSHGLAGAAAEESLQEVEQAKANGSSLLGRRQLQRLKDGSMDRPARADEGENSTSEGIPPGVRVQQQWGEDLQSVSQQERQEEASTRGEQDPGTGEARMESLLHRLATVLLPSRSESRTPQNRDESPRTEVEPSEASPAERSSEAAELTPAGCLQRAPRASSYTPLPEDEDAPQEAWGDVNKSAAPQHVSGSTVDASYTQAQKQALQEVLRGLITDFEEGEGLSQVYAREAGTNAGVQHATTMQERLRAVLEQWKEVPPADASPSAVEDGAAGATRNAGYIFHGAASPQSCPTPRAGRPPDSIDNELLYSLLYGQTGSGTGSLAAGQQQRLHAAAVGDELIKRGGVGPSLEDASTLGTEEFPGAGRLAMSEWSAKAGDISPLSRMTPCATESAGGAEEQVYGAPGDEESPRGTENELAAAAAAPGTAGYFAALGAATSPLKKRRSRYSLAAALADASPSSVGALHVGERGLGSSQSPGRGSAGSAFGAASREEKYLAAPTGIGRSRRSRRASSSSRRSAEGSTGTPRGSSGEGIEMAAAAAAATAELSAREEAGAATPTKGRQRGVWAGSHSPSPSPRHHANEAGGPHKDGGFASVSHQKQQAGAVGIGEDEMVPLGALPTGVYFDVARRLWRCQWREEGRLKSKGFSLGHYATLEEAREACILYKCAVSNIPLDPAWLVPEYLPASMASKRLVKHRQPSSLPLTSPENSPVPIGMDEPHSPLAAESATTTGFTPSSEKSVAGIPSRYDTPTTPRAASAGRSTDKINQFLFASSCSAAAPNSVGTADCFGGDSSSSSSSIGGSVMLPCSSSKSPGSMTVTRTEDYYTQGSSSTTGPHRELQLYSGEVLSPVTPSSDDATIGECSTANRKRRRFGGDAGAAEVALNSDDVGAPRGQFPSSDAPQLAAVIPPDDVRAAGTYTEGSGFSAFSRYLPSGKKATQGIQKSVRLAEVLPAQGHFCGEVSGNRGGGTPTNWPVAQDIEKATGGANARPVQERPGSWSVGYAGSDVATDVAHVAGGAEESVDVRGRCILFEQPRSQAPVIMPAAACPVIPTGNEQKDQHSSAEGEESEYQEDVLAASASESIS